MGKFDDVIDFFNKIQLSNINGTIEDIRLDIKNIKNIEIAKVYGKIISAENDIKQSYYEDNHKLKEYIQCEAQCKINEGISILQQDFINIIEYFVNWDNINVVRKKFGNRKYSEESIKRNMNQLCNDYLYLKKGIFLLIKLKKSQGIVEGVVEERERVMALEEMIDRNEIYTWLPPENEENSWQHQLIYGEKYNEIHNKTNNKNFKLKQVIVGYIKKGRRNHEDM